MADSTKQHKAAQDKDKRRRAITLAVLSLIAAMKEQKGQNRRWLDVRQET